MTNNFKGDEHLLTYSIIPQIFMSISCVLGWALRLIIINHLLVVDEARGHLGRMIRESSSKKGTYQLGSRYLLLCNKPLQNLVA